MESGGKGPLPSSSTGSRSDPGGTSVENIAVVPGDTGNVLRLSITNTPETESNPTNSPTYLQAMPDVIPQLAVWSISGNVTKSNNFRRKLQNSCSLCGEINPQKHMIHNFRSGLAGVVQAISCPIGEVVNFLADFFFTRIPVQISQCL